MNIFKRNFDRDVVLDFNPIPFLKITIYDLDPKSFNFFEFFAVFSSQYIVDYCTFIKFSIISSTHVVPRINVKLLIKTSTLSVLKTNNSTTSRNFTA